ncbi:thiamine biosynthesis protein thio [Gluconobacter sp. DsW_056]|uniref:FAD-dependent oxidoreductase n=1 Tax=Gluconobacter sp. DsW_056 TaxID=1511209 RepID=UPI000A3C750F|nr:FAD-dependent oxidoreductase [Gluconobacter sp. DsW_056]OUI83824.1 thiamine biosynthesis protein thio [Gluconobacter sp. DsW_056]
MIHSVLGEGVAALCCATALSDRGLDVEVIVPEGSPEAASRFAGGMLAPFCEGESAPDLIVAQGQAAVNWWAAHVPDVTKRGTLVVAPPRDGAELDRFARATQQHDWVVPGDLEPDLEGRFARGLFFPTEAHLDPRKALASLRDSLLAKGVTFRSGTPCGHVVDCRGLTSRDSLADLRGVRGEMLIVHAPDVSLTRPVRLLHPRFPCYVVPRDGDRYMIGATMVESARPGPVTARAAMELLSAAYTLHPGFAEAEILELGAGLRPSFPDNIPAVRHVGGRSYVNGMYRHGFLMAPVCAERLAAELAEIYTHAD